jgi:hypothetical protein
MPNVEWLENLAQEVIAMVAPMLIEVDQGTQPHPMDLAALIMSEGLTMAGRTLIDERGIDVELEAARLLSAAGNQLGAALSLVRVALRAHELHAGPVLGRAWCVALELMKAA